MRSLLLFLKQINASYKLQFTLIVIFGLLNSVFQGVGILLVIPIIELYADGSEANNKVVDLISQFGSVNDLGYLLSLYFAVLVFVALFKGFYNYFSHYVTSRLGTEYAVESFKTILKADWSFYIKHPSSKLVNLFKTESRAIKTLTSFFFRLILSGLMIIVQLALAFFVSWKLTLASVLILGVLYFTQTFLFKKDRSLGSKRIWINEYVQQIIGEVFQSIKFLKLHRQEDRKSDEFKKVHFDSMNNELKKTKLDAVSDVLFTIMGASVIVGVIYIGLTYELVSISSILVLLVLLSRSISQVQSFTRNFRFLHNQLPSFEKFHFLVKEAKDNPSIREKLDEHQSIDEIRFEKVNFSYNNSSLIDDQNYTFEKGEMYLLFGPSGVGKTTTLDLVSGLIQPQSGIIEPRLLSSFSYVLQETLLFAGSIKENICLGENYSDKEILESLELVGLKNKVDHLENGINTLIKENASNFSGGEKQRLALARAIISKPQVLLLDEFTSALDAPTESEIMDNLHSLKNDMIVIIVSHRERTKDWVDEVINF